MEFINEQVAAVTIPKMESLIMQPLQPVYLTSLRIRYAIVSFFVLTGMGAAFFFFAVYLSQPKMILISGMTLLILLSGWSLESLSFHRKGFAIREKDIIYRSGWLYQQTSACPFNRIQHCSVFSGPIDRKFGLATLRLYTAGTDGDFVIPGLPEKEAFAIREFITQKIVNDEQSSN